MKTPISFLIGTIFLISAPAFAEEEGHSAAKPTDAQSGTMTAPAGGSPDKSTKGPTNVGPGLNGANMGSGSSTATGQDTTGRGEPGQMGTKSKTGKTKKSK